MMLETVSVSWPGWEVVRKLGEGSFGGVYEIQRTLPDGTVERAALKKLTVPRDPGEIKELYAQRYDSASITAHFHEQMQELVREYTFMQKLGENPNVVHCQDLRTIQHDDGIGWDIYIRMELLKPLKLWLDDRYNERRVIRLGLNLCSALNGCHQRNIIHRDIKPENILVAEDGRFKLGDFGIAKVSEKTATGTLTGTYGYMAPEIANRQHYGASADIYSLGLVMYWMMNERTLPFLPLKQIPSSVQRQEAQDRRFSGEEIPAPVNGTPELTRIVLKACAFDPKERYSSVRELAEDLKRHYQNLRNGTVRGPSSMRQPQMEKTSAGDWDTSTIGIGRNNAPPQPKESSKKKRSPRRGLAVAGIAVLVFAAGLGISKYVHTSQATEITTANGISSQESSLSMLGENSQEAMSENGFPEEATIDGAAAQDTLPNIVDDLSQNDTDSGLPVQENDPEESRTDCPHLWENATYDHPKKCTVCGLEDGLPIAYVPVSGHIGLRKNGTARVSSAVVVSSYQNEIPKWKNLAAICDSSGDHVIGLRNDGTVVAVGFNNSGQCDVDHWQDIVAVACGDAHTVGLRSNGTVIATGSNSDGQCNVEGWTDIVAVSASGSHTIGVRNDGSVISTGSNDFGQCNFDGWENIVAIATGYFHTVGVCEDGTVLAAGRNSSGECDVGNWTDIVAVSVGNSHTLGLRKDGTVVAAGNNYQGQCVVSGWHNVVAISACADMSVAICDDGSVRAQGYTLGDIRSWKDMLVWQPKNP